MYKDCFPNNYIEIRGDCDTYTTQSSGISINGLPGLSLKLFSQAANDEQITGVNMAKEALEEGINRACSDFLSQLSTEFLYSNVITNDLVGNVASPPLSNNIGTDVLGRKFTKVDCDRFTVMYFGKLKIYVEANITLVFNIIDGNVLTTKSFDLIKGVNTVFLDYTANTDIVVISYDQTLVNSPDKLQCGNCNTDCDSNYYCLGCSWHTCNGYTSQEVVNTCFLCGGTESVEHYVSTDQKSGLAIEVSIKCSDNAFLCMYKDELKFAIRYAMGIHIAENAIFSPRANPTVRNSKDELKDLLVNWDGTRNETTGFKDIGKYQLEMGLVVKRANKGIANKVHKTRCLACNSNKVGFAVP